LLVIDKANGGKADALNCGVNFSRYRYLCCVDGDSVYYPDALIAGMSIAAKDPANVLAVTSLVAIGRQPDIDEPAEKGSKAVDRHVWTNLQHLEILRAFMNNRLAWSRMGFMLCVSGAFGIWRRDVILEVGGFSSAFTCEDIEITFRVIEAYRREGRPGKILSMPNIVGVTEGPERLSALISQRARWQRVTLETVWHYRRMLLNPRYGTAGMIGAPYILLSECLGPFMQVSVLITLIIAVVLDVLDWTQFLSLVGIQIFALGLMSTVSLWMTDWSFRYYRLSDITRLILIAPLDLLWYRPILAYAHLKGLVQFLRRDKSWDRFDRNVRRTALPPRLS
jgi:cellulose synthase/poly-beta-1,6-N-acetylglucosamine synthase-like glycosyltransferase